jgi:hypothetical protein
VIVVDENEEISKEEQSYIIEKVENFIQQIQKHELVTDRDGRLLDNYYEIKPENRDVVIMAKGQDGILYRLVLSKINSKVKNLIFHPTDFDSKNNRRRLDRTFHRYIFI